MSKDLCEFELEGDLDEILAVLVDSESDCDDSSLVVEVDNSEYYPTILKPRILRGDIRRSYSNMLANVVNSGDFPLLYGMFDNFFSPCIEQITVKHLGGSSVKVVRQGLASVITLWYALMHMEPDVMVSLGSTEVHLISSSNCSRIVSKFKYCGTRVYELPSGNEQSNPLPVEEKSSVSDKPASKHAAIDMIINSMEAMKRFLPLMKTPTPFTNEGYIVLYTDDNKFITKIEIETHESMMYS